MMTSSLNKKSGLVLTLTAIAVSALLAASPAMAKGGKKRGGQDRLAKVFDRIDSNDDQLIDVTELTAMKLAKTEKKFARKDADEDGFLTFEEATAGRTPQDLSDVIDELAQCVADIKEETGNENIADIDPDAYMSPQERFDNADTSGDGVLDIDEVKANAENKALSAFEKMDADASGGVDFEEFSQHRVVSKATRRAVRSCLADISTDDVV